MTRREWMRMTGRGAIASAALPRTPLPAALPQAQQRAAAPVDLPGPPAPYGPRWAMPGAVRKA